MAATTAPTFATLLNDPDYRANSFAALGKDLAAQLVNGFKDTNKHTKIKAALQTQGSIQAEKEQEKRVAEYKASIAKNQKAIVSKVLKTALFTAVAVGAFIACFSGLGMIPFGLGALKGSALAIGFGKVMLGSAMIGGIGGLALSANNVGKIIDRSKTWAFNEGALNEHEEGAKSATLAHEHGEKFDDLLKKVETQETKNLFGSDKAQDYIKQIKTGEHIELPMITDYPADNQPDGYGRFNFADPYLDPLAIDPKTKQAYLRIKPGMVNQLLTALEASAVPLEDFKFEPAVDATPQKLAALNASFPDSDKNLGDSLKYMALAQAKGGMPTVSFNLGDLDPSLGALGSVKIAVPLTLEQQEQAITATRSADMGAYVTSMKKAAVVEGLLRKYGDQQKPGDELKPLTPEQRIDLIRDIKDGKFDGMLARGNPQAAAVVDALNSIVSPTMPGGPLTVANFATVKIQCEHYYNAVNALRGLSKSNEDNTTIQINCLQIADFNRVNNPQFMQAVSSLPSDVVNNIVNFKRDALGALATASPPVTAAATALTQHNNLYTAIFPQFMQTRGNTP
ncbi:MAG: hypothetical protein ACK5O9_00205 [Holosporales bacterium]